MKRLLFAAGLFASCVAFASGDYAPPITRYKAWSKPDTPLADFQNGRLGVLQPGMRRIYLYTAWRAITLGPKLKQFPGSELGLDIATGAMYGQGWIESDEATASESDWKREAGVKESLFSHCPYASGIAALATLREIRKRQDATPARLKEWVDAQEMVFAVCKNVGAARYGGDKALAAIPVPAALGGAEPAYWRQLREYQRGAALFHVERYDEATVLFDQIGAIPSHPARRLGRYMALRSQARLAYKQLDGKDDAQRARWYAAIAQRGEAILSDPALDNVHEATRAALRASRVYLTPLAAVQVLGEQLRRPEADPYLDDTLGDWSMAVQLLKERPDAALNEIAAERRRTDFFDWIETLHQCAYPSREAALPDDAQAPPSPAALACTEPRRHANAQWQRTQSRPWLVAALMLAERFTPGLERAAAAVPAATPEYLTVRYHMARLTRLAGHPAAARAIGDAALAIAMSPGSRNLFAEERLGAASSVTDAAPFLLRTDIDLSAGAEHLVTGFNDDAINWLTRGVASADMAQLAQERIFDTNIRARLAAAAWMRAELLGKTGVAMAALRVLEPLAPVLKPEIAAYRAAPSAAERRHRMLLTALRFGLSPQMQERSEPIAAIPAEEVTASAWCTFTPAEPSPYARKLGFPWLLPALPALGQKDVARAELAALAPLKSATGFVGAHALAGARTNPHDPDLPWLLHVVVRSTRGGCRDPDYKKLSRAAYTVLHQRFPSDRWAARTPYYY